MDDDTKEQGNSQQEANAEAPDKEQIKDETDNSVDNENINSVETDDVTKISLVIPDNIKNQYAENKGKFYQKNADRKDKPIFIDKGNKLQARNSNPSTARALVSIAEARHWEKIKVRGNNEFKREVWLEASTKGIQVDGYRPTAADKAVLSQKLLEKEPNEISSVQREKEEGVSVKKAGEKDQRGPQAIADTVRNNIAVASLVTGHPEMVNEAAIILAAEKFSKKLNPKDQESFVSNIRDQVASNIEAGKPAQQVNITEQQPIKTQEQANER